MNITFPSFLGPQPAIDLILNANTGAGFQPDDGFIFDIHVNVGERKARVYRGSIVGYNDRLDIVTVKTWTGRGGTTGETVTIAGDAIDKIVYL